MRTSQNTLFTTDLFKVHITLPGQMNTLMVQKWFLFQTELLSFPPIMFCWRGAIIQQLLIWKKFLVSLILIIRLEIAYMLYSVIIKYFVDYWSGCESTWWWIIHLIPPWRPAGRLDHRQTLSDGNHQITKKDFSFEQSPEYSTIGKTPPSKASSFELFEIFFWINKYFSEHIKIERGLWRRNVQSRIDWKIKRGSRHFFAREFKVQK